MDKTVITLTDRCRFHYGDEPDAWQAWFDDSAWEEVLLPHDWSVSFLFSQEYSSGTGYLAGGIGWYRLRISPQKEWQGKRIRLVFDGVYKNSRVWCNSYYLGHRPNGYISFSYDITEQFHFDRDNVIAVSVDHRDISDSRWFTGSGITRQIQLIVEEPVHPLYQGIFFTTPHVTDDCAQILVQNEILNTLKQDTDITITNTLLDRQGDCVGKGITQARLKGGETVVLENTFTVTTPALWSPEYPALYRLETYISYQEESGAEIHTLADVQNVGIRSFRFDPDQGFFLNGQPLVIKGVCVHHDAGCLGAAVYKSVWRRRLGKLKKMGCNAIRTSHNPHMPALYELCDELGFLVMDEAFDEWEGPKNKWWQGHNVYPPKHQGYYLDFPQWHRQDLSDLVRRDRNHPCVILWSIGNEIDYPNDPYCHPSFSNMTGNNDANKPAAERQYNPDRPNAERLVPLARQLCQIVRENDPTRPVTLAAAFPELSAKIGFLDSLDVIGYNYKEHLYAQDHTAFPDKAFLGSENSHSYAAWRAVTDNPFVCGQFLWTGIDYLGEAGGWPVHGSGAGVLDLAGFEKPGYFRRQSFWSDAPMLHLVTAFAERDHGEYTHVSECWDYPAGSLVLVKCYTNLPRAAFFLNGQPLGIREKNADSDCISFTLPFQAGELRAEEIAEHAVADTMIADRVNADTTVTDAKDADPIITDVANADTTVANAAVTNSTAIDTAATDITAKSRRLTDAAPGKVPLTHSLYTTGCACQFTYTVTKDAEAGGRFLYQIELTMTDAAGHRVYSDESLLHVHVEKGYLLGMENGDLADTTPYSAPYRRAHRGQLLLYVLSERETETPIVHINRKEIRL